jgi:hypothetical protein
MEGYKLLLKPVRLLVYKLVHIADGYVQGAARFGPKVVPSAARSQMLTSLLETVVSGVQMGAELREVVHEFVFGAQIQDAGDVSLAGIIKVDSNELAECPS